MNSKSPEPQQTHPDPKDDPDAATPSSSLDHSETTAELFQWKNWNILPLTETESTNEVARQHPAWTVIVADRQSSGRGRHGRYWTSDEGGLWLSAVLPTPGDPHNWRALPLAVGLAVVRTLATLQVTARMRWPNDIMVKNLKLAGLLLERYHNDHVVAGIGINLGNSPTTESPELQGIATTLREWCPSLPGRDEFLIRLLNHLQEIHHQMTHQGVTSLVTELNQMWGELPRPVELHVQNEVLTGYFCGITETGDLILENQHGEKKTYAAAHVSLLREKFSNQP